MKKTICLSAISLLIIRGKIVSQDTKNAVITINTNEKGGDISPPFYGLMNEEINYAYDSGLYGELIRNRAFKDNAKVPENRLDIFG